MEIVANEQDMAALWSEYRRTRDTKIRDQLVEKYLLLVKIIAGRIAISLPSHIDRDDLLSSGFFGLLDAVDRYDPERQNKFETYAGVRIRGAMLDYLRSRDFLPPSIRQKARLYEKEIGRLEETLGRSARDEEIAAAMKMDVEDLHKLEAQLNAATVIPLDEYMRTESARTAIPGPAEILDKKEMQRTLAQAIGKLPEKPPERQVVALYYYEELTMHEIGQVLHLTEARVSQLHTKAIFRLRGYLARAKASLVD